MKPLNLLYIVRHYGPVGGMERYVWELTRALSGMGHHVSVLCENLATEQPEQIRVIELGEIKTQHRWLRLLLFSRRVSTWVTSHPEAGRIIHSHERTGVHQFTTFHGPPFASVKSRPLWQRFSPRIFAHLWLEQREVHALQVQAVIPNSPMIANALDQYYPDIGRRLTPPIAPGVAFIPPRQNRHVDQDGGVIGFVGKEWKRKGLDIAVAIVAEVRKQRPDLEFIVAGPAPDDILYLFKDWHGGFTLLGETDSTPLYQQFDLLLHPARQEPYGMVIAEARAAGVPVLVSDTCGIASELDSDMVLSIQADVNKWAHNVEHYIGMQTTIIKRDWRTVAREQLNCYMKYS